MKILSVCACFSVILSAGAFAQSSEVIIKQRAQEIRDQNNVRQGVTPASRPAPAAQPTATSAAPNSGNMSAVQQAQARLRTDLATIKASSQVTADQKQRIAADLMAIAQGPGKPSMQDAAVMAEDLSAAYARKPLSDKDRDRLLSDLAAILNPGNIQKPQMDAIYRDVQAIFQVNDDARKDATKIADDARAAGADVQKGAAK